MIGSRTRSGGREPLSSRTSVSYRVAPYSYRIRIVDHISYRFASHPYRIHIPPHCQVWGFIALTCDCRGRVCNYSSRNLHVVRRCPGAFPDRSRRELSKSRGSSPRGGLFRAAESAVAWICPLDAGMTPTLRLFTRELPHCATVPQSAAGGISR